MKKARPALPNPAEPGGSITYTLTYANNGDADATETAIVDDYDENYLSAADTGFGDSSIPGEVRWEIGSVPVGGSGSVSYTATVDPEIPIGTTTLENTAVIDCFEDDWNEEDNTDSASVKVVRQAPVQEDQVEVVKEKIKTQTIDPGEVLGTSGAGPNFKITKTNDVNGFIYAGGNVEYTIVLINDSSASAYNVIVEDVLTNQNSEIFNIISWGLGEVFPYEKITIEYTIATNHIIPAGIYTNTAEARGADIEGNSVNSSKAVSVVEVREKRPIIKSDFSGELTLEALPKGGIPEALAQEGPLKIPGEISQGLWQNLFAALDKFSLPLWILAIIALIILYYLRKREKQEA